MSKTLTTDAETKLREEVAVALCSYEWAGTQPGWKTKPASFRAEYLAKADAVMGFARPLLERIGELERALKEIAKDGRGLQGLLEESAPDAQIAEYWMRDSGRRKSLARQALGKDGVE